MLWSGELRVYGALISSVLEKAAAQVRTLPRTVLRMATTAGRQPDADAKLRELVQERRVPIGDTGSCSSPASAAPF